jgi:DNA-binding response OmpR family regulator
VRLLLVEDDRALAEVLRRSLADEGHAVDVVHSIAAAQEALSVNDYRMVVLDLGLPDGNGEDLCRRMRADGHPAHVLMLTARDSRSDRIGGLDAGADDYVTKPFDFDELAARVRALGRRPIGARQVVLRSGDLELDPVTHSVRRGGVQVALTAREFALLRELLSRAGDVVTKTDLLEQVWDAHYDGLSNVVEVHVANLRRKLELPGRPAPIETVRGAGYRVVTGW